MALNDLYNALDAQQDEEKRQKQAQATYNLHTAYGANPDDEAEKVKIARETNTPVELMGDPEVRQEAGRQAYMKTVNLDESPGTVEFLSNHENAKIAAKQIRELGEVERKLRFFSTGALSVTLGSSIKGMGEGMGAFKRVAQKQPLTGNLILDVGTKALSLIPSGAESTMREAGKNIKEFYNIRPEGEASFADQTFEALGQLTTQLPLFALSAPLGGAMMFGQGADQMADKIASDKRAQQANQLSQDLEILSGGAITGITEYISSKIMLKPSQVMALKNVLGYRAANIAVGGASETLQELTENIGQDLAHIMMTNPDSKVGWLEAVQAGGVGGIAGTVATSVIQAALHIRARGTQRRYQELSDASKAQKLRDMDGNTYQSFTDAVTSNLARGTEGAVDAVYIDANTFHQALAAQKINPEEVAAAIPSIGEQIDEAKAAGLDLVIPLNEFAGKIAGTEIGDVLSPHIRSSAESFSVAEMEEAQKAFPSFAEIEATKTMESEQKKAFEQSANEVRKTIYDELTAAGTYTPAASRIYSSMVRDFYTTQAAKMGVTPTELYARLPYKVLAGEITRGQMTQGGKVAGFETLGDLRQSWQERGIENFISEKDGNISLSEIKISKENRGKGIGSQAMQELAEYADRTGQSIALSPSKDFGATSVKRLEKFYKRFGFVSNKGRSKDFRYRETMIRRPQNAMFNQADRLDQTYTPAFKKWFGDWESAAKYAAVQFMDEIEISTPPMLKEQAADIFSRIQPVNNKNDGRIISFVKHGFKKIVRHKEKELIYRIIPNLDKIAVNALPIYSEMERDTQKHANIDQYYNYLAKVNLDGNRYYVRLTTQALKDRRNELHNVFISDIEITKAGFGDDIYGISKPSSNFPIASFDNKLNDWLEKVKSDYENTSKVVDANGNPLVVYSGHANAEMYGTKYEPRKSTAGGFYASEDPDIATGYAMGKLGSKEYYEHGNQYRLEGKNGKLNKKLWQYDLSQEQKKKIDELAELRDQYGEYQYHINDMRDWAKNNKNYEQLAQRILYNPYNLQNIWEFNEYMGYNIAYAKEGQEPVALRQQKNETEELLDALGIKWNAYDWHQPGIMPVYLIIKNPLDADQPFPQDVLVALKKKAKGERAYKWEENKEWTKEFPLKPFIQLIEEGSESWTTQVPKKALAIFEQFGYDGIKERGQKGADLPREKRGINWIAFHPTQIKSAIGNRGTFDPNNPDILYQDQSTKRGGFNPETLTTVLGQKADYSTFLHESAHFFLTAYSQMAAMPEATPQIREDMQTVLDWFGVKDLDTWNSLTLEQQRKHHEAFAYNFEIYLFGGKAPSIKMQGVFERFAAWLKKVYQSIRDELNVVYRQEHGEDLPVLTGEVKQVMDRMLASDEQIAQAEAVRGMTPLFATQAQSGMDDATWAAYQALNDEAHDESVKTHRKASLRQMKWLSGAKSKYVRLLQTEANYQRRKITDQVTKIINEMPIYVARDNMKNATPDEQLAIADAFGYDSVDALKVAISNAPKKSDVIREEVDVRMLEEHGELATPQARERAADEAIHNEARAKFIAVELRHLSNSQRPVRLMQAAAQQAARNMLSRKALKDLRPRDFTVAEARAAKAAEKAMAAGDFEGAIKHKENQLLNNMMAAEALAARAEIETTLKNWRKLYATDKTLGKSRDMNFVSAARAMLAQYSYGKELIGFSDAAPSTYLDKIRQYDPEFYAEIEPMINIQQTQGIRDLKTATLEEFRSIAEQIDAFWHLSRRNKQMDVNGQLRDRQEIVSELNDHIRSLNIKEFRPGYNSAVTKWEKAQTTLMGFRAALRRVEAWSDAMDLGRPEGPFRTYIWNPISEAVTKYRLAKTKTMKEFVDLATEYRHLFTQKQINAPELNYTFNKLNSSELFHALLHTGNMSNKKKLLLGRGWASLDETGKIMDTRRWDAFIARCWQEGILTKEHYDFAQKVWDFMERMKPAAQKSFHEMYGYYFNEITADPIETPWGIYNGGYVPAKTDPELVRDATMFQEKETALVDNSFMFPTTGRGFTMQRVEYNKPLKLDIGSLATHIDAVLRMTYIEPHIKDVARIVKTSRAFGDAIDAIDPTIRGDMLVPWLQRTAMQMVSMPSTGVAGRGIDRFFSFVRANTGMQIMVANITNTLQQFTGIPIAALKVKPRYLRNALWMYMKHPQETTEMISNLSDFMKTRVDNYSFEMQKTIEELLLNPSKYEKLRAFTEKHGYFMQTGTQGIVDTIAWMGAYNEAVERGADQAAAVKQADSVVRETQGSFAPEDISRFETGSPFVRAFTHFYSYFNMWANLIGTEFTKVARDMGVKRGAGRLLYIYAMGFMAPAVIAELIVQAAGGFDTGDDDEWDLWDAMRIFFGAQGRAIAGMVPIAGPTLIASFNAFNNKPYDDRISTSPALSMLETVFVKTPVSVFKAIEGDGSWKKATRNLLTTVGFLTRLPLGQLGKPLGYAADVAQGKAKPESAMDVARGVLSGKDVNRKQ